MGFWDIFRTKKSGGWDDPQTDFTLDHLRVGGMVDFDLKTWQVTARHHTDWGEGDRTEEWQLKSYDDLIYLEKSVDDEEEWCICRSINFHLLGPELPQYIIKNEDPPETIVYQGITYYLTERGGGLFYKDGTGPGQPMLAWDYEDDSGKKYLTIEQWGEQEFEAFSGESVEAYQFTNILPPPASRL